MKIAYYIDTVVPTKQANMVHVMRMCQAFSDLGHETTLFCDSNIKDLNVQMFREQYSVSDDFQIRTVHIPDILHRHGHRLAAYYGAWRKAGIRTESDVAYSRSAATLLFLRHKIRYVYEAHMEPDLLNRRIEYSVLKHRNCVGVVVISEALKKRYLETDIKVLHDAADEVFQVANDRSVLQTEQQVVNVGYVGHLYPGKCMETLIPLAERCQNIRFHIVGGTDEWLRHWKARVEEYSLRNIVFYGYVENCNVGRYYSAFDVVILPFSRSVQIGKSKRKDIGRWISPLKLFEAMAYGKPIIVTRLATIEEVMSDGEDCVMVEPDNIEDWVEKLNALCGNPKLWGKIGTAAQEKLKREYTWLERAKKAAGLFELIV